MKDDARAAYTSYAVADSSLPPPPLLTVVVLVVLATELIVAAVSDTAPEPESEPLFSSSPLLVWHKPCLAERTMKRIYVTKAMAQSESQQRLQNVDPAMYQLAT